MFQILKDGPMVHLWLLQTASFLPHLGEVSLLFLPLKPPGHANIAFLFFGSCYTLFPTSSVFWFYPPF